MAPPTRIIQSLKKHHHDHGKWAFTIHTMNAAPSPQDTQALPPGTWSFTFTLP